MASWIASGPGRSMQKFSACKKRAWLIHRFFSTSSVCMIAIWPAGPPNEINPSLSQKRKASAKEELGFLFESPSVAELLVSELLCRTGPSSLCWPIISGIVTSLRRHRPLFPSHCRKIERKTDGAEGTAEPERSRMVPTPEGTRRDPDWHNCKASGGIIGAH